MPATPVVSDLVVYGWQRSGGWRVLANPDASERKAHQAQLNDLIFYKTLRYHRSEM
jgi:hypothetical protein